MRHYDPAYSAAMKRIEAGEIGVPVVFKSIGRDKDGPSLSAYKADVNGMLFYGNTIHDFDLARWLMQDEVSEVHAYTTVAIRPEVAQFGDVVASVVNLKFAEGAIGNIESHAQAAYGYDVRTEVVGSKGSIMVGSLNRDTGNVSDRSRRHADSGGSLSQHVCRRVCGGDARLRGLHPARSSASHQWRRWTESIGNCGGGGQLPPARTGRKSVDG